MIACKKSSVLETNLPPVAPEITVPSKDTTSVPNVPTTPVVGRTLNIGTGSGDLIIDGTTLSLQCNDIIRITQGSYKKIVIKNIQIAEGCNVYITNNGLVEINGDYNQMSLSNLKGVVISGDGDKNIEYGFQFHDNVYRAITISGTYTRSTIQHASFKNIKDYVISYSPKAVYDGTEASFSQGLKFLNILCDNTGSFLQFTGSVENGLITGLVKDLEIAYLNFSNSSTVGTMIWMGNVDGYDVHNNRVNNINTANNNHNGIFHLMGNGKFHSNFINNHQGNALRAWTYSIGTTPKDVLIYDNIVVNSRKYSAFEVQSFAGYMNNTVTYANAQIFNNTCGNLNLDKDWLGNVVDVYNLQGGYCKVFNNIGFNFPASNPLNKISNQQSSTNPSSTNNLYFNSISDVGFSDLEKYTLASNSSAKNKGVAVLTVSKDFYGNTRNPNAPSIGAVE